MKLKKPNKLLKMKRNEKNIELLKHLIKMRKIIRKKHQALKAGKMQAENVFRETFKPITEPLEQISKKIETKSTKHDDDAAVDYGEDFNTPLPAKRVKKEIIDISSTPRTSRQQQHHRPQLQDSATESFSPLQGESPSVNSSSSIYSYLHKSMNDIFGNPISPKDMDFKYGIRYDAIADSLKIGNEKVLIDEDNRLLHLKDKAYHLTPGLYKLITLKNPQTDMYTKDDLKVYGEILSSTNAYRRNYKPNQQIQGGKSRKYKTIIKNIIRFDSGESSMRVSTKDDDDDDLNTGNVHSGRSLMKLPRENVDYTYWDDPNELVDRLRLLIASQQAGHNNHQNEIISIIDELREADIIY